MAWGFGSFGAPSPSTVANNAGMGPFGSMGWGGSSSSSGGHSSSSNSSNSRTSRNNNYSWISPTEKAEQTVRGGRKASNQGVKGSDIASANEPVNGGESESSTLSLDSGVEFSKDTPTEVNNTSKPADYSFITNGKNNENRYSLDTKSAVEKQNKALETLSKVHDRNWYSNDQIDDINIARNVLGLSNMKGTMAGEGVNKNELKNKQIEVSNRLSDLNNPEMSKLRNDIRNVADVLGNNENIVLTDNSYNLENKDLAKEFQIGEEDLAKEFQIGEKVGKNIRDIEKDYLEAYSNYEAAKALKDENKEKEAKEALDIAKKAMSEQIALEKKVAEETINEFIEMATDSGTKYDDTDVGDIPAIKLDGTKIGDLTVHITRSDVDEGTVNVSFVTPDGREVNIGQVATDGYDGAFLKSSLESTRNAFKRNTEISRNIYEKQLGITPVTTTVTTPVSETSTETAPEKTAPESISVNSYEAVIQEIDDIDVSKIESKEQAEATNERLSQAVEKLGVEANNYFETLVSDLTKAGKSLEDVRNSPEWKSKVDQLFEYSQKIYDKTSVVEEYTDRYFGDVDISSRRAIKQNLREVSDKVAEMQGAKRIVHKDNKGNMSIVLNNKEVKALANYGKSIESTKDAAVALMKSAAFNGAKDIEGEFYSTAYKNANAMDKGGFKEGAKDLVANLFGGKDSGKLTWGDWTAASVKGALGVTAAVLGAGMMPVNPVIGTMFMFAGIKSATETGAKMALDVNRTYSTNRETMFGSEGNVAKNVMNDIYNRSFEKANFGDPKSVKTYTAAANVLGGITTLATGGLAGLVTGYNMIKDGVTDLATGGLTNNTDRLITNVFSLGKNIVEWGELNPEVMNGMTGKVASSNNENKKYVGSSTPTTSGSASSEVKGGYGTAKGGYNLSSSYSGYREQAKDSNLAKDYNKGMEEEVREAVSDKYVKMFKVMIDKEPDYIRKVLIAIPKTHSEREWK